MRTYVFREQHPQITQITQNEQVIRKQTDNFLFIRQTVELKTDLSSVEIAKGRNDYGLLILGLGFKSR